eukprot:Rmarinus@m.21260
MATEGNSPHTPSKPALGHTIVSRITGRTPTRQPPTVLAESPAKPIRFSAWRGKNKDYDDLKSVSVPHIELQSLLSDPGNKICVAFSRTGHCPRGDKCQFLHQRDETRNEKECVVVVRALWRSKNNRDLVTDVTDAVQNAFLRVGGRSILISVKDAVDIVGLEDPDPESPKELVLTYAISKRPKTTVYAENGIIEIDVKKVISARRKRACCKGFLCVFIVLCLLVAAFWIMWWQIEDQCEGADYSECSNDDLVLDWTCCPYEDEHCAAVKWCEDPQPCEKPPNDPWADGCYSQHPETGEWLLNHAICHGLNTVTGECEPYIKRPCVYEWDIVALDQEPIREIVVNNFRGNVHVETTDETSRNATLAVKVRHVSLSAGGQAGIVSDVYQEGDTMYIESTWDGSRGSDVFSGAVNALNCPSADMWVQIPQSLAFHYSPAIRVSVRKPESECSFWQPGSCSVVEWVETLPGISDSPLPAVGSVWIENLSGVTWTAVDVYSEFGGVVVTNWTGDYPSTIQMESLNGNVVVESSSAHSVNLTIHDGDLIVSDLTILRYWAASGSLNVDLADGCVGSLYAVNDGNVQIYGGTSVAIDVWTPWESERTGFTGTYLMEGITGEVPTIAGVPNTATHEGFYLVTDRMAANNGSYLVSGIIGHNGVHWDDGSLWMHIASQEVTLTVHDSSG